MNKSIDEIIRIGYQGAMNSNAHHATQAIIDKLKLKNVELVPLISSSAVIEALGNNDITYGVVAVENNIAGVVKETQDALAKTNMRLDKLTAEKMPIHHALFKIPGVPTEDIEYVASHIQALLQTWKTRAKQYPYMKEKEIADTAIGAEWLAEGKLDKNTAILCSKSAGYANGLELIADNVEDSTGNYTEFCLYQVAK